MCLYWICNRRCPSHGPPRYITAFNECHKMFPGCEKWQKCRKTFFNQKFKNTSSVRLNFLLSALVPFGRGRTRMRMGETRKMRRRSDIFPFSYASFSLEMVILVRNLYPGVRPSLSLFPTRQLSLLLARFVRGGMVFSVPSVLCVLFRTTPSVVSSLFLASSVSALCVH